MCNLTPDSVVARTLALKKPEGLRVAGRIYLSLHPGKSHSKFKSNVAPCGFVEIFSPASAVKVVATRLVVFLFFFF